MTGYALRNLVRYLSVSWVLWLLATVMLPTASAQDWSGSAVSRGYVLDADVNRQSNPRRHCVPHMFERLDRQAVLAAPPGGWPGEPQAVVVFNVQAGEVMISHGRDAICGQMHDMRTRDSRFRAGVGQVVVPRKGNTDPIVVVWETPLLPEWIPTIKLGSPSALQLEDTARLLLRAACMAVTIALALSALMGWLAVRERPFLHYTFGCVLLFVWQALINGLVGYPSPWIPFATHVAQWQTGLGLFSSGLMLVGLFVLSGAHLVIPQFSRYARWAMSGLAVLCLTVVDVPADVLGVMAALPMALLAAGSFLVLMLAVIMLIRRHREAIFGLVAVVPFLAIVAGEMSGARWWITHRVDALQIASTWLLMIAAYALNRRLGLIRLQRDEMRRLADTDGLTGLPNRRFGLRRLKKLHAAARDNGGVLTVAFLDVDHFKSINDSCGHDAGDQVLVAVARMLSESVRGQNDVIRMGGEEFLILLPGVTADAAAERMETVRERMGLLALSHIAPGLKISVSIGVAQLVVTDVDADMLLRRADKAMYQAKQAGRDRVQLA